MIAGLRGVLEAISGDLALVAVGGVVFQVHVTQRATATFTGLGERVALCTYLHLREDAVALYGFADEAEREVFLKLTGVTGVGPRLALTILSALGPQRIAQAVAQDDPTLLSGVSGVGKQRAGRIVLELKGKLGSMQFPAVDGAARADLGEIQAALSMLGYSQTEVQAALRALPAGVAGDRDAAIRASLLFLSDQAESNRS